MEKVILKLTIDLQREQIIDLPIDAEILSIGTQSENIRLWFMTAREPKEKRKVTILVVPTGQPFRFNHTEYKFLGTVHLYGSTEIYHIFKVE